MAVYGRQYECKQRIEEVVVVGGWWCVMPQDALRILLSF